MNSARIYMGSRQRSIVEAVGSRDGLQVAIEGVAELPLHDGHVPRYLMERMKRLGSLIARFVVEEFGPEELVRRLADPLWFQAFNNVIGMDWDSSGSTTVVVYVLKSCFPPILMKEHDVAVLGGKGRDAIGLPSEAAYLEDFLNPSEVVLKSRYAAKVDSVALQDGYTLYIHSLVTASSGQTVVVQQGMNLESRTARRYHILMEPGDIRSLDKDPHSGVASVTTSPALNLVNAESRDARKAVLDIAVSTPVEALMQDIYRVNRILRKLPSLEEFTARSVHEFSQVVPSEKIGRCPRFYTPVTDFKRIEAVARAIKQATPREFPELLLIPGLGPETMRAIALVADLIYGYEPSFRDPTTHPLDPYLYAYAHGGKDGVPYKVKPREIDKTIEFFENVINSIKTGEYERKQLLENLSSFARRVYRSRK